MFETEHYRRTKEWVSSARVMRKSKPIDSRWACYVLGKSLPENVIVVEELTSQRTIAEQLTFLSRPNSYFGGHIGGLGTGLGFALGAKLVSPERFVVALIGDGALSYNPVLACLGFSQEYDTPILIVVFNNESYDGMKDGLIKFYPKGYAVKKGTFYGSTIEPTPDYAGVIRAMGGYGTRVDNPIELEDVVQESVRKVQSGNTALVDIMLAPGARR